MKTYFDTETAIDEVLQTQLSEEHRRADARDLLRKHFYCKDGLVTFSHATEKTPVDGLSIDDPKFIAYWRTWRPHDFPTKIEESLAERAFAGRGNLKARADLIGEVGEKEANRVAIEWGLRGVYDTRHGRAPEGSVGYKPRDNAASNPWSAAGWSITRQGEICKSLGIEKAAALARAAGCVVGSTKPARAA